MKTSSPERSVDWFQAILPQSQEYYSCSVWSIARETQKNEQTEQSLLGTRAGLLERHKCPCNLWTGREEALAALCPGLTCTLPAAWAVYTHKHWCEREPHGHVSTVTYTL